MEFDLLEAADELVRADNVRAGVDVALDRVSRLGPVDGLDKAVLDKASPVEFITLAVGEMITGSAVDG